MPFTRVLLCLRPPRGRNDIEASADLDQLDFNLVELGLQLVIVDRLAQARILSAKFVDLGRDLRVIRCSFANESQTDRYQSEVAKR